MSEGGKTKRPHDRRLNDLVAVTVVVLTVFLAIGKVKDDNIVQAMQKAQAASVDAWAEYQSTRIKLHGDENGLTTLRLLESSGVDKTLAAKQTAEYEADIKKYEARSKETRAKAEALEREYDRLNMRDDQFDFVYASHCLEQDVWSHDAARFGIDLWLRTEALSKRFVVGQIWRPATPAAGARTTLRETVRQVVLSLVESLRAHESHWLKTDGIAALQTWGTDSAVLPDAATWDYQALAEQARHDIAEITPLLEEVLEPGVFARLMDDYPGAPSLDDDLWVRSVYAFAAATHLGHTSIEHLADMLAPIYMRRASGFMAQTASESPAMVQARLNSLCETFLRLKPALVARWSVEV